MALTYFRPRGDIKTNWETINPVLKIREMGIEWDTEIGVGRAKIKFGDGATAWNDLDYAVNIDESVADAFDEYSQSVDSPFVNKNIAEINNNLKIIDQDKNITQTASFTGDASTSNEKSILSLSTNHGENGVVIRGVASPEEDSDVTNKKYVDDKTSIANTDKVGVVKESEEIAVEEDGAMKLGKILDKYGVVGEAQQSQLLTDIIDVISNKVMNDLMSKSLMSSVQTNSNSTVPTSGLVYNMNQQISELDANGPTYFYLRYNSTNGYLDLSYIYVKDLVILAGIFVINIETPPYSITGNVPKSIIPNGFLVYDTLGEYRFQINPIGIFQNSDALPAGTYIVTTAYIKS